MCEQFNDQLEQTPSWLNHIWFSDEAHFHLNGAINNHNNIFWGEQTPEEISEKQLKGVKVTAFIAFNAKHGLLGPYWFEEHGNMITVNSPHYCVIMQRFHDDLSQKITPRQLRVTWFMQDGATSHTVDASAEFHQGLFGNHLIDLQTKNEWTPHSLDLNPLDFWFRGASNGATYANKSRTLMQLMQNMETYVTEVTNDIWKKADKNFCLCLKACFNRKSGHIENLYYKKFV